MTAEGGGEIPNHGNFLLNGIPHPASPGAPFHKGAWWERTKRSPKATFPWGKARATARVAPTAKIGLVALARQTQAQKRNRTSRNFYKPRARWPGRNLDQSLRFCAPEILQNLTGTRPP